MSVSREWRGGSIQGGNVVVSWSFSVKGGPADSFAGRAMAAAEKWREGFPAQATPEAEEEVAVALDAANLIIASGALGLGDVAATLSGHANAGHEQAAQGGPDSVAVNVFRQAAAPHPAERVIEP